MTANGKTVRRLRVNCGHPSACMQTDCPLAPNSRFGKALAEVSRSLLPDTSGKVVTRVGR